ncbi:RteC domain-containing protein [Epilithonimonas hominis]|uniref:RteC domain-containing protein n=1 Tax=Epilithonimonas hominis TaxID=420404 RepID=UPI0028989034|nr:RteC domain-containing protein [Epilithonimonas hominis]
MSQNINNLLQTLLEQINFIELEIDDVLLRCEKSIELILITLEKVRNLILKNNFKTEQEEITFFKTTKPQFTSKLIYYNSIYRIETKKPSGGHKALKKYYIKELAKLKSYFDTNLDFYKYYRTGSTFLDYKYFVRGKFDIKLSLDNYFFETDKRFATSHDFKVAKILANDLLRLYLENQLIDLEHGKNRHFSQHNPNAKLNWTGSKVALTELIYALQTEGVFNNGSADLKDIAEYFSNIFNIEIGQYRRTFLEIRVRKDERAKFISSLREKLIKRMDDTDESIY